MSAQPAGGESSQSSIIGLPPVLGESNPFVVDDFNVLRWGRGVAHVTGREDPPPGLKFSGIGFRGEADRLLADHEVTRILRGGCDPGPFPLWLRASETVCDSSPSSHSASAM